MGSSLLNTVDNLAEDLHRIKSKSEHDNKKYETYEIQ